MKKIGLLYLLLVGLLIGSCGKSGPEADAQKMCEMIERSRTLKAEGNQQAVLKLIAEVESYGQQLEEKYKNDQKSIDLIKEKVDACMGKDR